MIIENWIDWWTVFGILLLVFLLAWECSDLYKRNQKLLKERKGDN